MLRNKIKYKFDFGTPFKMILSRLVEMFENIRCTCYNVADFCAFKKQCMGFIA